MGSATKYQRLNLGCGGRPLADAVNHDREKFAPHVDVSWDLEADWPQLYLDRDGALRAFSVGSQDVQLTGDFAEIHARDVLEHVPPNRFYHVMDSMWRQLRPGGKAYIQVPEANSRNALIDPTHWRGLTLESFDFLDPTTRLGRASWTTQFRWSLLHKERLPRTDVNLSFILEKLV